VTINLGIASTQTTVPGVVGKGANAARSDIEAAGLVFAKGADTLLAPGDASIGRVVSQDPTQDKVRTVGDTVTVSMGAEGAVVPNLFTNGGGACPGAVTQATASNRLSAANLTMTVQTGDDDYFLSWDTLNMEFDLAAHPECEGRTTNQSPPPGTIVAKNSEVTVAFDPVNAPADTDIYGRLLADVVDAYQNAVTLMQATSDGGVCNSGGAHPDTEPTIGAVDPAPTETIPFVDNKYTLHYWLVDNTAPNNCS
jgi:hypothetical protein